MASESASGLPRNELLLQYIQELGYDVDFKTSRAKLEKNSEGRITEMCIRDSPRSCPAAAGRCFCQSG